MIATWRSDQFHFGWRPRPRTRRSVSRNIDWSTRTWIIFNSVVFPFNWGDGRLQSTSSLYIGINPSSFPAPLFWIYLVHRVWLCVCIIVNSLIIWCSPSVEALSGVEHVVRKMPQLIFNSSLFWWKALPFVHASMAELPKAENSESTYG